MANRRIILFAATSLPIIVLAFFGVKAATSYLELKNNPPLSLEKEYREKIESKTDAYSAARLGMIFLKTDQNTMAEAAFTKATDLDKNWRDGWIWRGYTELKLDDSQGAIQSLQTAEKLDPVYSFTYQLLSQAYQKVGNTSEAKKSLEKQKYLSKK